MYLHVDVSMFSKRVSQRNGEIACLSGYLGLDHSIGGHNYETNAQHLILI